MYGTLSAQKPFIVIVLRISDIDSISKQEIEKFLGKELLSFAYPNGKHNDYNTKCIDILKNNGFAYAVTTELGTNNVNNIKTYPFELKRVCISYNDNMHIFKTKISAWVFKPYLKKLFS